jgi:tRNA pseudouridine55 synthase
MEKVLNVYKPPGMTPLQAINVIKKQFPEYQSETLSYAGRLDPMAEGVLLILVGEANKKRHTYEALKKTYEFEILFGIETDSYDLLGIPKLITTQTDTDALLKKITAHIPTLIGTFSQPFPPFSSVVVKKKPLFYWARSGLLADIQIPEKKVTITSLQQMHYTTITSAQLLKTSNIYINRVDGKFRQEEILSAWNKLLSKYDQTLFPIVQFEMTCTSGTYVRSLASSMGKTLQTGGLAYHITRTGVGDYTLDQSIKLVN